MMKSLFCSSHLVKVPFQATVWFARSAGYKKKGVLTKGGLNKWSFDDYRKVKEEVALCYTI